MSRIVVGIDGSESSWHALELAAAEAALRGAWLTLVSVWDVGVFDYVGHDTFEETRRAEDMLAEALAQVHRQQPEVLTEARAPRGRPTEELLRAAADADLLVVGSRGLGGFRGLLLGSVSDQVAHHAPCPVMIARAGGRPIRSDLHGGLVVVGVDGSAGAGYALRFALAEAALRRAALRVVCAWTPLDTFLGPGMATLPGQIEPPRESSEARMRAGRARATIPTALQEQTDDLSQVRVEKRALEGDAISALLDESKRADLIVVGSRGHGTFAGTLLGSVSRGCAHHARCPVAIVRG